MYPLGLGLGRHRIIPWAAPARPTPTHRGRLSLIQAIQPIRFTPELTGFDAATRLGVRVRPATAATDGGQRLPSAAMGRLDRCGAAQVALLPSGTTF